MVDARADEEIYPDLRRLLFYIFGISACACLGAWRRLIIQQGLEMYVWAAERLDNTDLDRNHPAALIQASASGVLSLGSKPND